MSFLSARGLCGSFQELGLQPHHGVTSTETQPPSLSPFLPQFIGYLLSARCWGHNHEPHKVKHSLPSLLEKSQNQIQAYSHDQVGAHGEHNGICPSLETQGERGRGGVSEAALPPFNLSGPFPATPGDPPGSVKPAACSCRHSPEAGLLPAALASASWPA